MTSQEEAAGNNPLGKWDKELEGIWVAKFEMSREDSTDGGVTWSAHGASDDGGGNVLTSNAGNGSATKVRAVSKPNVASWRKIQVNNQYNNAKNMHARYNSHLMKNSEWGAVAYLTYSAYGRNGNELAKGVFRLRDLQGQAGSR